MGYLFFHFNRHFYPKYDIFKGTFTICYFYKDWTFLIHFFFIIKYFISEYPIFLNFNRLSTK